MCLPLTALIFMSVNFVILLTITSIQIYEEELMRVYFQLMYYSWINTSKHQNHPIRTSNHTQAWHEMSKGLSVETGGVWWNASDVSNWGEFLKASSWNVPHDHIFASFWLTELAQYLPRSWSAQNLTSQKSLSPGTPSSAMLFAVKRKILEGFERLPRLTSAVRYPPNELLNNCYQN